VEQPRQTLAELLRHWRGGSSEAGKRVIELVYDDLREIAGRYMRAERPDHTLQPTALVHEFCVQLLAGRPIDVRDRAHLLAVAARQLRRILINHARDIKAAKRGAGAPKLSLDDLQSFGEAPHDILELHLALSQLEQVDKRAAEVVELRYFGGLTEIEIAEVLGSSVATVKRDWTFARTWLLRELLGY
jgi:RNA polymerase sigma factor (TIGR02999 family)